MPPFARRDRLGRRQTTRCLHRPRCPRVGRSTTRRAHARSPRAARSPRRGSSAAIRSTSNAMWPPMCTRKTAFGRCARALRSKSSNDMQRSSRLQSTNSTCAPAAWIASGVAMNVFDGQSTVCPRTSKNSSAASAAPVQLDVATAGKSVPARPGLLERARERPVRPLLGVERRVPERVQPPAVAVVEPDGELCDVHRRA